MSVEGKWSAKIQSPMGEQPMTIEFSGADELTGSVASTQGNTDITGKLDGDSIEFKGEMSGQMGTIELEFKGTVNGDEMSGDVQFGSFGSGSWSATRE